MRADQPDSGQGFPGFAVADRSRELSSCWQPVFESRSFDLMDLAIARIEGERGSKDSVVVMTRT